MIQELYSGDSDDPALSSALYGFRRHGANRDAVLAMLLAFPRLYARMSGVRKNRIYFVVGRPSHICFAFGTDL